MSLVIWPRPCPRGWSWCRSLNKWPQVFGKRWQIKSDVCFFFKREVYMQSRVKIWVSAVLGQRFAVLGPEINVSNSGQVTLSQKRCIVSTWDFEVAICWALPQLIPGGGVWPRSHKRNWKIFKLAFLRLGKLRIGALQMTANSNILFPWEW